MSIAELRYYSLPDPPHFSVGDPSLSTVAEFMLGEGSKGALGLEITSSLSPAFFSSVRFRNGRICFIAPSDLDVAINLYPRATDLFGNGSIYIIDALGLSPLHA